jgi:Ca-activated chloride channel family protein
LLDNLAQNHRGTTTYVRPGQAVDEAVSGFYAKVSSPVLSNIALDFVDVLVEQTYPQVLPDLFAGTQLILTGRYRDGGASTITLSGEVGAARKEYVFRGQEFRASGGQDFIPRLWATRAIGHLLREIRLGGENDELVQSVVNLSIRYGIITPYTSYLIEEDDIFSQAGRDSIVAGEIRAAEEGGAMPLEAEVEEAAVEADMAEAEAPLFSPLPTPDGNRSGEDGEVIKNLVEFVGSKTFVWREGSWIDTAYTEDELPLETISFAGEAYFDLLSAAPEMGQYLALGEQVLVVHDGVAYQVVPAEEAPQPVQPAGEEPGAEGAASASEPTPTLAAVGSEDVREEENDGNLSEEPAPAPGICAALLVFPGFLALAGLVIASSRPRKRAG